MKNKLFMRPCRDCDEMYRPTGRSCKYCEECIVKRKLNSKVWNNNK